MADRPHRKSTIRRWAIGLAVPAAFGAAIAFVALTDAGDLNNEAAYAALSAGEARALGARWRMSRDAAQGVQYAQALLAAGLYDELLTAISERGLFRNDAAAAQLFRAEATLRQGRFDETIAASGDGSAFDNPYLSFARARAAYGLTSDADDADADLARALRGPVALTKEAWLFRARLALDANDLETAEAAARRAIEAGADARAAEAVGIERLIRENALDRAAALLSARGKSGRRAAGGLLRDDARLGAMIALRSGDARAAVRFSDEGRLAASTQTNDRLLAALAKWRNGDLAQAYSLVSGVLASSPDNWMAIDLGAAIARDVGREDDAASLIARLAQRKPALALFRAESDGAPAEDIDGAFRRVSSLKDDLSSGGVAAALLGGDGELPASLTEPGVGPRRIAALAKAISDEDARAMRKGAEEIVAEQAGAIALTLAGEAFRRVGDFDRADDAFGRASAGAPNFFRPVVARSRLFADQGNRPAAIGLLREFLAENPASDEARLAMAILETEGGAARAAAASFAAVAPHIVFANEESARLYARAADASGPAARRRMLAGAMASSPSHRILGQVYAAIGEDDRAAAAFRLALIAEPTDSALPALYEAVMHGLGRDEQAAALLSEIVKRHPEAAAARVALAGIEAVDASDPARF